jgi:hypothetical protein
LVIGLLTNATQYKTNVFILSRYWLTRFQLLAAHMLKCQQVGAWAFGVRAYTPIEAQQAPQLQQFGM